MFLSDRDIKYAIQTGKLIVKPPPEYFHCEYDPNSIDLHLDDIGRSPSPCGPATRSPN